MVGWMFRQGLLAEVFKYKLVFIETSDAAETSIALENYRLVRKVLGRVRSEMTGRGAQTTAAFVGVPGMQQRARRRPALGRTWQGV